MTMTIEKIEFPRRETKQNKTKKSLTIDSGDEPVETVEEIDPVIAPVEIEKTLHDKGTFRLSCSLFHGPLHHHLAQSQHSAQLTDTATGFLLNLSDQLISLVYRQFSQIPVFGVLAEQISQSFICPSRF